MGTSTTPEFVGTREAAVIFGVRPPNFVRDWASRPDFPVPAATLTAGRVWRHEELVAYRARSGPRRGATRRSLHLSPDAERWLPTIKRRIVRRFRPDRIVIFGSQARGEARGDSDADLLVVIPGVAHRRHTEAAIYAALAGIPLSTDVVVATPDDIDRHGDLVGTVLRPALREGITIYAKG